VNQSAAAALYRIMGLKELREIMGLRRAGKFYDHPIGPIGLLDLGQGRLALLGQFQLDEIRFGNLSKLACALTPRDPAWDDSLCPGEENVESRTVRAPELILGKWVTAAGEIAVRNGCIMSASMRFAEEPLDDTATEQELEDFLDRVHAKLVLV
jgi:hypothetical protein